MTNEIGMTNQAPNPNAWFGVDPTGGSRAPVHRGKLASWSKGTDGYARLDDVPGSGPWWCVASRLETPAACIDLDAHGGYEAKPTTIAALHQLLIASGALPSNLPTEHTQRGGIHIWYRAGNPADDAPALTRHGWGEHRHLGGRKTECGTVVYDEVVARDLDAGKLTQIDTRDIIRVLHYPWVDGKTDEISIKFCNTVVSIARRNGVSDADTKAALHTFADTFTGKRPEQVRRSAATALDSAPPAGDPSRTASPAGASELEQRGIKMTRDAERLFDAGWQPSDPTVIECKRDYLQVENAKTFDTPGARLVDMLNRGIVNDRQVEDRWTCVIPGVGHKGKLTLLWGESQIGKTTWLDHAVRSALFPEQRNRFPWPSMDHFEAPARIGIMSEDNSRFDFGTHKGVTFLYPQPADLLVFHALNNKFDALIIDSLYQVASRQGIDTENSAGGMQSILNPFLTLARETSCAVVVVHHSVKDGSIFRGSTAIRAITDTDLQFRSPKNSENLDTSDRLVTYTTRNRKLHGKTRLYNWRDEYYDAGWFTGSPAASTAGKPAEAAAAEWISRVAGGEKVTQKEMATKHGVAVGSVKNAAATLKKPAAQPADDIPY